MLGITKVQAFVLDLVGITGFGDMRNRMAGRALQALDGRMGIQGVQRDLVLSLLYPTNAIMLQIGAYHLLLPFWYKPSTIGFGDM